MAISEYLQTLINLKDRLANILQSKGATLVGNEKLNALVEMVNDIEGSDGKDENVEAFEKVLYSFGVLSDPHIIDSTFGKGGTETNYQSQNDYAKALTFFQNSGCEFVGIAGDVVWNSNDIPTDATTEEEKQNWLAEWVSELQIFKNLSNLNFEGDVFACAGNHDANPYGYSTNSTTLMNTVGLHSIIPSSVYGDGTMNGEEVWEEIIGKPLNFVHELENGDVLIFHSMYYWQYHTYCRDIDIEWLEEQFELYKDHRVFLFFHLPIQDIMLPTSSGLLATHMAGYASKRIYDLLMNYKNVIWFGGHSHYKLEYDSEEYPNANVYQIGDSATMIHCSSCCYPREVGSPYANVPSGSQGYIVDVYADRVIVKGIDFTKGNGGAFIPNANYVINK